MLNDIERLVQNIINIVYCDCGQIKVNIKSEKTVYIRYTQENGNIFLDKWEKQDEQLECVGTKYI